MMSADSHHRPQNEPDQRPERNSLIYRRFARPDAPEDWDGPRTTAPQPSQFRHLVAAAQQESCHHCVSDSAVATIAAGRQTGCQSMSRNLADITPIRSPCQPALSSMLLELNNAHITELSLLDEVRLQDLLCKAYRATRIGTLLAFLLSLDQDADHDGTNFRWFCDRYERFVYVDRIVVAGAARGRGLASALYEDLIGQCRRDGYTRLVCEVNSTPPNPHSDAFHAAFGFQTVGEASIDAGSKTVRYLSLSL
jgi:uncharacterized protein